MTPEPRALRPRERHEPISEATTHRLSLLLRAVRTLDAEGVGTVSSQGLATRFGLNSAQIRKDLTHFGELGVRGVGYRVRLLRQRLEQVMGLDRRRTVVIVGAGNLGHALADSRTFNGSGFHVAALFDSDGRKAGGRTRLGVPIRPVSELPAAVRELGAEIGVLAVPPEAVPEVARQLAKGGVRGLLNFAAVSLPAPDGVVVRNVDLGLFLESLAFQLG